MVEKEGLSSLFKARKRGLDNRLEPEQGNRLKHLIIDKTPDQLKMENTMWMRKAIMELIKQEISIECLSV
jgi:hypothetical protein